MLLENEENDVFFFRRALSAFHTDVDLRVVDSVSQARDYLNNSGRFTDRNYYGKPDLIVTDFKMNGHTGVQFIRWIKERHDYKEVPVVMFSGTALAHDKSAALESGAAAFFQKSGDFKKACDNVSEILKFLPKQP